MQFTKSMLNLINAMIGVVELSKQEKKILEGYFEGKIDAELADELKITKRQVRGKRQNIYAKLGYKMIFFRKMAEEMKWPK